MKKTTIILRLLAAVAFISPAARADQSKSLPPTPSDWTGIRTAHETWRHRFESSDDGSHLARNPGQQWTTRFDGRGFLVEPAGKDWRWGMQLRSYGIGDERQTLPDEARVVNGETRLSYRWNEMLEEWFLNDTRGMEQGWTFSERPAGASAGQLRLDFAVRGDLDPKVQSDGLNVVFSDGSGEVALRYGGLKAWDAKGRDLPVRFLPGRENGSLSVEVDERDAVYPVTIDPVAQQARLKADNAGTFDAFGTTMAISGDTVVVGAPSEDGVADGIANSGAAYVFVRNGDSWTQQAYLRAFNAGMDDYFGDAVAISGDLIVIGARGEDATAAGDPTNNGAPEAGAAYVFSRNGEVWSLQARLKASNAGDSDSFGSSVAVSNGVVVVGAPYEDQSLANPEGTNNDGFNNGAVYVFEYNGAMWAQTDYLKGSDNNQGHIFGFSLALSGNTLAVGASEMANRGKVYVFTHDGAVWNEEDSFQSHNIGLNDQFGCALSLSGDTLVVGALAEDSGLDGLDAGDDDIGAAYVFVRSGTTWSQQAFLKAHNPSPNDFFGSSVAISGNTVVVGAPGEDSSTNLINGPDDNLSPSQGAAYVYTRKGSTWSRRFFLKGGQSGIASSFGRSLALSGNTLFVGASGDDNYEGAAYTFLVTPDPEIAPTLQISGKKKVRVTGATSRHTVKGTAADADGNLLLVEAMDSRPKGAKKFRPASGTTSWTYRALLKPGRNSIQVVAVDAAGNRSKPSRITVIRK